MDLPTSDTLWKTLRGTLAAVAVAAVAGAASAATYVPVTLDFEDLADSANGGVPLDAYMGFSFDAGTFYVTALTNNTLITNSALVITRTDGKAFYFDSLKYSARGGDSEKFYFLAHNGAATVFDGADLNANDDGYFKTDITQPKLTELSGFQNQLITRLTIVSGIRGATSQDYQRMTVDDLQFRIEEPAVVPPPPTAVPEPASWALMLLGFGGAGAALRRRRRPLVTA